METDVDLKLIDESWLVDFDTDVPWTFKTKEEAVSFIKNCGSEPDAVFHWFTYEPILCNE